MAFTGTTITDKNVREIVAKINHEGGSILYTDRIDHAYIVANPKLSFGRNYVLMDNTGNSGNREYRLEQKVLPGGKVVGLWSDMYESMRLGRFVFSIRPISYGSTGLNLDGELFVPKYMPRTGALRNIFGQLASIATRGEIHHQQDIQQMLQYAMSDLLSGLVVARNAEVAEGMELLHFPQNRRR